MSKVNVIYDDLYSSAKNLVAIIDYLEQAKDQLEDISKEIEKINEKHSCYSKTEQGIADLTRDFANYITEVTFLQNQCMKAATAFKDAEGKNAGVTDEMRTVINDGTIMLGIEEITEPDITAYNKREDFDKAGNELAEDTAADTSQTWNNTFVEDDDKTVSINSDISTKAESIIDPEKEAEKQEEPEEPKPDEEPKTEPEEPKPDYNPPKGTTPSEEKSEGDKQEKSEEETKNPNPDEGNKPKEETTTETETSKESSKEPKTEEPSTVTPPSETQTETTTTTTTPTEPQQETYVPPADTGNNNNNWQPSNPDNNPNETPIKEGIETGEETPTTEPEIPEGSSETGEEIPTTEPENPEVPGDEIIKGNEYTKIPTSDTPIETKHKSGNSFIPIAAGLSAAAAAGIGAKVYMDRKNNNDNGEEDFTSEELNSDESTISNQTDNKNNNNNNNNTQEDTNKDNTPEEDNINNDDYSVKPEKYGARNNNEIADLQQ